MAAGLLGAAALVSPPSPSPLARRSSIEITSASCSSLCCSFLSRRPSLRSSHLPFLSAATLRRSGGGGGGGGGFSVSCCLPLTPKSGTPPSTRLYVTGLSFRTTEESLRNAFQIFGELVEVNLVMDRIANRPRGFAFLRYATEEESKMAIEGMHGKFLDGRVIFVEVAKPKSKVRQASRQSPRQY